MPLVDAIGPQAWPRPAITLAWLLAVVHAATALGKLLDIAGFAAVLSTYRMLPAALLLPASRLVVLAEAAIAVSLLLPAVRATAAWAAAGLATLNGLVLTVTLLRGIALPNCSCFGVFLAQPLTPLSPLEDVVLAGLALALLRGRRR